MAHWRKTHPQTTQTNLIWIWAVRTSMLIAALVLIARHAFI